MPLQIQDYTIRHDLPLPLYYQVKQALYSAITEKRLVLESASRRRPS